MKRLLVLLPLLALLAGCSQKMPQSTANASASQTETATQATTETVSQDTRSALASVMLDSESFVGFMSMGADLLLFEKDVLTILDAQMLETVVTEKIPGIPQPGSGLVWTHADGVAYFDASSRYLVFLGTNLKETMRMQLPEDMIGAACLSPDWSTVYYCTASEIRALDMKNGLSRLVMAHPAVRQSVSGVILDGKVLNCVEQTAEGTLKTVLISAQTGKLLYEGTFLTNMVGKGSHYYLTIDHRSVEEIIYGTVEGTPQNLWPAQTPDWYKILPEKNAVVTACKDTDGIWLDYYDLSDGCRSASICLKGQQNVTAFAAESDGGVWILCGQTLYLWYPDLSLVQDQTVYSSPRYTRNTPDTQGLANVQTKAQQLAEQYAVTFLLGEDANQVVPWDYSFETEYIPRAYENALSVLERVMAQFPENFFAQAAQKSENHFNINIYADGKSIDDIVDELMPKLKLALSNL